MNKQGYELFGRPGGRDPGNPLKYDTLKPDFSKAYIKLFFSLATIIAKEDWNHDPSGVFMKLIPAKSGALARSHYTMREYLAVEYIRDVVFAAEGNNTPTTSDGRPILSTAHPRSKTNSSVTWSNRLATASDLSVSAIQAAQALLRRQKAPDNFQVMLDGGVRLLASTDQFYVAREILKSAATPYTANRTQNFLQADNIELSLNPYWAAQSAAGLALGVFNSWLIQGENHSMTFYYGNEEPEIESQYNLPIRSMLYVSSSESSVGADNPYSLAGSPGA